MFRVTAFLFLSLVAALCAGGVSAAVPPTFCSAVTGLSDTVPPARYDCAGQPETYQQGSLWLKTAPGTRLDPAPAIYVHQTRFERLTVDFTYADGAAFRQSIRRGAYGTHWRVGGQLVFEPPLRTVALSSATLRFDHLASHELLRIRLLGPTAANAQAAVMPVLVGGALTLLAVGALYTFSLGAALRRAFLLWHGLWGVSMVAWGLLWSQLALIAAPGLAGSTAQISTFLSCLAVTLATISTVTALGDSMGSRLLRIGTLSLGVLVSVFGIPVSMAMGAEIGWMGQALGIMILADLGLVVFGLVRACRAGNADARSLAGAWALPMATLALTQFIDMDAMLFGGGSQLVMLLAAALQTAWLSVAITLRLAHLRDERDIAVAAEARMSELANRDALTGLLNRRGFIERADLLIEGRTPADDHFGLLIIDIDHFKRVNDSYGHKVGDAVLCRIARRLERWEGPLCVAGRLGGEEFVLGVTGLTPLGISQFAESVRREIAACQHPELRPGHAVTVSIGVASADRALSFQRLYGWADQELYQAKSMGRNRVVCRSQGRDAQALAG